MAAPSYSDTEKKVTSLNLSVSVLNNMRRIAKEEKRSVSYIADELLAKAIKCLENEPQPV